MDLKTGPQEASLEERDALDRAIGDRGPRHRLLPALHALNDRVGWISPGGVAEIARRLDVAPADVHGVASFYALFALAERPPEQRHVCVDLACLLAGASPGALAPGEHPSPCLGLCERAPAALHFSAGDPPASVVVGGEPAPAAACPQVVVGDDRLVLLRRVGAVDPASLDDYRAHGGYLALRQALEVGPEGVIAEVTASGLVGRGGAAFPAGRKWAAVAHQATHPHLLVANADESEPGTFKDRVLMEGDPFALVEAMTIAGYATGSEQGYIYLRGEYPRAEQTLRHAIDEARARGFLGDDIGGSGLAFDIELFRGAGAYICGEETAIFNSIEGFRGEPRSKPPFPVEVGLFGLPTLVNNVETLVNVLPILLGGGERFAATGSGQSTGTKLFCVSGSIARPGLYEVPFGTTLRQLVQLGGGVVQGRELRAVLLGGAAGSFVLPDQLDLPLTFEATGEAGATLGSGVVMVLDDTADLPAFVRRVAAFFRDESCGQCIPCRVGTVRQEEALHRLSVRAEPADLQLVSELGQVMRDASICGLGQTASSAIESAIARLGVFS